MSYQKAEIIYDATVYFCNRFYGKFDRTIDQMVQAARSGKQNIAEGSQTSGTSKETEIKLMSVARSSLEELVIDYEDFLRVRQLPIWGKDHKFTKGLRELNRSVKRTTYETFRKAIEHDSPEICANTLITLIRITTYLLDKQIKALEIDFVNNGGLRERMSKVRIEARKKGEQQT